MPALRGGRFVRKQKMGVTANKTAVCFVIVSEGRGEEMDNAELSEQLRAFQQGRMDALANIYQDLRVPLYTVLFRITHNASLSEDLLQELFVKLYRLPLSSSLRNPRAYLFSMARHLALDALRRPSSVAWEEHACGGSYDHMGPVPFQMDLEKAMEQLDAQACQVVTLHLNADLTFRQIAHIMKLPLGTVLWKYRKAIDRLRTLLSGGMNE